MPRRNPLNDVLLYMTLAELLCDEKPKRPTILTFTGETGGDGADDCTCGGKMWCAGCQEQTWPSTSATCTAPTPRAP